MNKAVSSRSVDPAYCERPENVDSSLLATMRNSPDYKDFSYPQDQVWLSTPRQFAYSHVEFSSRLLSAFIMENQRQKEFLKGLRPVPLGRPRQRAKPSQDAKGDSSSDDQMNLRPKSPLATAAARKQFKNPMKVRHRRKRSAPWRRL